MKSFKIERIQSPIRLAIFLEKFKKINGLRSMGAGAFAEVMGNPKHDDCYKVGEIFYRSGDDAYLEFLKLTQSKKDNPFFPKIISMTIFKSEVSKERWYVVRMEKLRPWNVKSMRSASPLVKMVRSLLEESDEKKLNELTGFLEALEVSSKTGKNLIEAVKIVNQCFKMARPDLHYDNMMMRKNGEMVITDPIAYLKPRSRRC